MRAGAADPRGAPARGAPPQGSHGDSSGAVATPAFQSATRVQPRRGDTWEASLMVGVRDALSGEVVCRNAAVTTLGALKARLSGTKDAPRLRSWRLTHDGRPLGDDEALRELFGGGAKRQANVTLECTSEVAECKIERTFECTLECQLVWFVPPGSWPASSPAPAAMEESLSESEAEESDESSAEAQEVQFEPRCGSVRLHSSRSSGHFIDAKVVSTSGARRAARLHVGKDGLVVDQEGRHPGQERVRYQMLMLPSVQICEEPGLAPSAGHTVLTIAGSWPTPLVNLELPKMVARYLQETLLGLVRKVTAGLHREVRFEVPPLVWSPRAAGSPDRIDCRDAHARGPLLCAGYVLYSSFADISHAHGTEPGPRGVHSHAAEPASEMPRYSLCYMELCGPTRVGDARAYLFSSHAGGESALLYTIIWPSAEDNSFKLIRKTENTVLRISGAEQAWVEPSTRSRLRRYRAEPSMPTWEVPVADYLAFRSTLEARAWMDLAASVYVVGNARKRLRDRVAWNATTTEGDIRLELTRGKTSVMVRRNERVAPFQEAWMPTDPQAERAREHIRREGDDVARLLEIGKVQMQMQLSDDLASSDSVVIAS